MPTRAQQAVQVMTACKLSSGSSESPSPKTDYTGHVTMHAGTVAAGASQRIIRSDISNSDISRADTPRASATASGAVGVGINDACSMQTDVKGMSTSSPPTSIRNEQQQTNNNNSSESSGATAIGRSLSKRSEGLISQLIAYLEQFELPTHDDFSNITPLQFSGDEKCDRFQYVAEMALLTVQLIFKFAKHLPGFDTVPLNDQIGLLIESTCELMILLAARRYDIRTDSIVFANNMPFTRDSYRSSGMSVNADAVYNFCRSLSVMATDDAEFAILAALSIFSARPDIWHRKQVEAIQELYVSALREYEALKRPNDRTMFPRLIMRVTELRTLGHQWVTDLMYSLKLQKRSLPPLLAEMWNFDRQVY